MAPRKKKKARKAKKSRGRLWLRLALAGLAGSALLGLALLVAGAFLWTEVGERFSGRMWSIPSRVYSDTTLLYPGQLYSRPEVGRRLRRLGYQEVEAGPRAPGQVRARGQDLEVYLRDLQLPSYQREGFPVRVSFGETGISAIQRLDNLQPAPFIELEPEEISRFFGPERESRRLVSLSRLPRHLIRAVLAAEDGDFFRHPGIDPWGILRAAYTNLRQRAVVQGGSTITQQLAKSYFLTPERTFSRKLKELLIAFVLEARYKKETILEIYLNEIYLGQNGSASVNGVGEAADHYFGKKAEDLSLPEAALLAGLIKAPNRYNPIHYPELSRTRRDQVLSAMRKRGWISQQELVAAWRRPVRTTSRDSAGRSAPFFTDYLSQQLTALYPASDLVKLGLSVYTTLDPRVQEAAETALSHGLKRLEEADPRLLRPGEKRLQGAVIVMRPKTGQILAMVGGRDYGQTQFNRAVAARRQPGSTFKPFVYLAALDSFTPASWLSNEPKTYRVGGQSWTPKNFDGRAGGQVRFRTALAQSINLPTVDLATRLGLEKVVETARSLGFTAPLSPYPSLALGAFEVTPLELARAYCALAADGVLPFPMSLRGVVDENGRVLERHHVAIKSVTTPAKAYLMSSLLRSVVTQGTARSLANQGIDFPVAGKTGTSNDSRDAWFVGYTPELLALVWVGFDDGTSLHSTGAGSALPIWAELMRSIPWQHSGGWFTMPPGLETREICAEGDSGQDCSRRINELFLAGSQQAAQARSQAPEMQSGSFRSPQPREKDETPYGHPRVRGSLDP